MTEREPRQAEPALSQGGAERRRQMRTELLAELSRIGARRARLRRTAAGTAAGASLALALVLALLRPAATQSSDSGPRLQVVRSSAAAFSRWAVGTDAESVRRAYSDASVPVGSLVVVVDDETLLRTLAAIGRPSGIVRSGERTWMGSSVVDAPDGG